MDDTSTLLTTLDLLPVDTVGIHPVHYAAIIGVNPWTCGVTPPTAPSGLVSRIGNAPIMK